MPLSGWVTSTPDTKPTGTLVLEGQQQMVVRGVQEATRCHLLSWTVEQVLRSEDQRQVVRAEPSDLNHASGAKAY